MAMQHLLLVLGLILFLLGLLTGLAVPILKNPRMGVASHLQGMTNGPLLVSNRTRTVSGARSASISAVGLSNGDTSFVGSLRASLEHAVTKASVTAVTTDEEWGSLGIRRRAVCRRIDGEQG